MEVGLIFLITSLISALGSLQLGPVNASVLRLGLEGRVGQSRWLAMGGSFPEFLYAALALWGQHWVEKGQMLGDWLNWLSVPVFLLLGIRMILTKRKTVQLESIKKSNQLPFFQGFILGMLNPQLPLFWLSILIWYRQIFGWSFLEFASQAGFILGTGCGAFGLLFLLSELARIYKEKLLPMLGRFSPDLIFGWFFVLLAVIQTIKQLA